MYSRVDHAYPWRESIIIFLASFTAYEVKRQFGLFAHQVFHLGGTVHEAWLGLGTKELITLATVILALAIYQRTDLPNAPWLERLLYSGQAKPKEIRLWRPALLATAITLAVTVVLSLITAHLGHPEKLFSTLNAGKLPQATVYKLWMMYPLALFGAPIDEEIFFRLGLVSILVWILVRILTKADRRGPLLLWLPLVVTGIYFGYVHVAENLETVQTGSIYLSLVINPQTWAGVIFGYVFCTYGLEASILTHFLTDAAAPFVLGLLGALTHLVH